MNNSRSSIDLVGRSLTSRQSKTHLDKEEKEASDLAWPPTPESYVLMHKLGPSGSGDVVYCAHCKPLNMYVAIKQIELDEVSSAQLDRVRKEIQALKSLKYRTIIACHVSFMVDSQLWLVLNLMSQGSLRGIMNYRAEIAKLPIALNETLTGCILYQTLEALVYIHASGRMHRNVKAAHIMVDASGAVALAGLWGSAFLLEKGKMNKACTLVTSLAWMAPEMMDPDIETHGYGFAADVWSFGITALELALGKAPYSAFPAMKVIKLTLSDPSPTVPSTLSSSNPEVSR
eukprot:TRINITY_DN1950_c1_g1_i2.p1 TRINITY_DN1950_c1_g1~~TRINITY_DN1950_c1_g1_i2.p1  ORF type:complete len:288 (+),score=51.83 TRINITY_DN1950_c1_g1_i2:581-1444(+)